MGLATGETGGDVLMGDDGVCDYKQQTGLLLQPPTEVEYQFDAKTFNHSKLRVAWSHNRKASDLRYRGRKFHSVSIWQWPNNNSGQAVCTLCHVPIITHYSQIIANHQHHHQVRVASEGCRVVAPRCPQSTAHLQRSPIEHVESFSSWSS